MYHVLYARYERRSGNCELVKNKLGNYHCHTLPGNKVLTHF